MTHGFESFEEVAGYFCNEGHLNASVLHAPLYYIEMGLRFSHSILCFISRIVREFGFRLACFNIVGGRASIPLHVLVLCFTPTGTKMYSYCVCIASVSFIFLF